MNTLKKIIALVVLLVLVVGGYMIYGTFINPKSPKGVVNYEKEDLKIEIVYHRPFKKKTLIFGAKEDKALVPYGQDWRLGANAATTSRNLPRYSLWLGETCAKPEPTGCMPFQKLIIGWSPQMRKQCAFGYSEPDYSKDVMRVNVTAASNFTPVVEQFTIDLQEDGVKTSPCACVGTRLLWQFRSTKWDF